MVRATRLFIVNTVVIQRTSTALLAPEAGMNRLNTKTTIR